MADNADCPFCDTVVNVHGLQCDTCSAWSHYHCTQLPAYMILSLSKSKRVFSCITCVLTKYSENHPTLHTEIEAEMKSQKVLLRGHRVTDTNTSQTSTPSSQTSFNSNASPANISTATQPDIARRRSHPLLDSPYYQAAHAQPKSPLLPHSQPNMIPNHASSPTIAPLLLDNTSSLDNPTPDPPTEPPQMQPRHTPQPQPNHAPQPQPEPTHQPATEPAKEQNTKSTRPPCKHYMQGHCQYGTQGNQCFFPHPEMCHKYTRGGSNSCSKGTQCRYVHPKLCTTAFTEKICLRKNCYFFHPLGTTREKHSRPTHDTWASSFPATRGAPTPLMNVKHPANIGWMPRMDVISNPPPQQSTRSFHNGPPLSQPMAHFQSGPPPSQPMAHFQSGPPPSQPMAHHQNGPPPSQPMAHHHNGPPPSQTIPPSRQSTHYFQGGPQPSQPIAQPLVPQNPSRQLPAQINTQPMASPFLEQVKDLKLLILQIQQTQAYLLQNVNQGWPPLPPQRSPLHLV